MEETFWAMLEWYAFKFHLQLLKMLSSKVVFVLLPKKYIINDSILEFFM